MHKYTNKKTIYKDGARVIVRSKLPEFEDLDEQQFEVRELGITWKACLAKRNISICEYKHIVKTKKTKCLVNETVEQMTSCYKRDVVLRIWICKYNPRRPLRKSKTILASQFLMEDRSLMSEDSAGEPEDSQDEGDADADDDPDEMFNHRPLPLPPPLSAGVQSPPRRGRGRPRKIPLPLEDAEVPEPSAPQDQEELVHSRNLRSSVKTYVHKKKSYKSSCKVPDFSSRVAIAQKKKNADLLAKLPPHVKKVPINFNTAGNLAKKSKPTPLALPYQNGPTCMEDREEATFVAARNLLLLNPMNGIPDLPPTPTSPVAGTSRSFETVARNAGLMKSTPGNVGNATLKRTNIDFSGVLPTKKFASSTGGVDLSVNAAGSNPRLDNGWLKERPPKLTEGMDSKTISIIPNASKWGAAAVQPSPGAFHQLVKEKGYASLLDKSAPILTPNIITKNPVEATATSRPLFSVMLDGPGNYLSSDELTDMPKLEMQPLTDSDEEDSYETFIPPDSAILQANTLAELSFVDEDTSDSDHEDEMSPKMSPKMVLPVPTVVKPPLHNVTSLLPDKLPNGPRNTISSPIAQPSNDVKTVAKSRNTVIASAAAGSSVANNANANVPSTSRPQPNPLRKPLQLNEKGELVWDKNEERDEELERDNVQFKKAFCQYWKQLIPSDIRRMQQELRDLRNNNEEYNVCKQIPLIYTSLITALKI